MANNNIIKQALDALKASLPMDDVMSTTAIKEKCVNDNDTIVKIMNVDFVCFVKENITKTSLNPTLATMQAMNNDKQQILLVTVFGIVAPVWFEIGVKTAIPILHIRIVPRKFILVLASCSIFPFCLGWQTVTLYKSCFRT